MKRIAGALVACGMVLLAASVAAVDLRDVLADYTLTSWSRKDGLSGPVWAFAQDKDGFLWIGNDAGLVRFDGVRFVAWDALGGARLPQAPVRSLYFAREGPLWVGFGGSGGLARVRGLAADVYTAAGPATIGPITAIVEDRAQTVWAAGSSGLFRFRGQAWEKLGSAQGLPDASVTNAYLDSAGMLWVSTAAGLFNRPEAGDERFSQVEASSDPLRNLSLSEDASGRIWASDPLVGFRAVGERNPPQTGMEAGRGYRLVHDRKGNLWVGTIGQGLWRVRNAASPNRTIERTTVLSGLSSDAVRSVFEDRDGNIWAGTTEGVDRLVPHRVTPWTGLGLVSSIDVTADDRILVGTADGVLRFVRTAGTWQPDASHIAIPGVRAVRAAANGRVWLLTSDGWYRIEGGRPVRVPDLPHTAPVDVIATDPNGGMFGIAHDGTVLHDDGRAVAIVTRVAALDNVRITGAFADRQGKLWIAFSGSRVGALFRGVFAAYGAQEGLGAGPHTFFEDREGALWAVGTDGLSRFSDGRFATITRANGLPPGGTYAIGEDESRNLWLSTSAGILRLSPSEFDAAVANAQYQVHFRTYDTSDGLAGFPVAVGDRNAARASDGTLWFVTSRGLSVVQPRALEAARPAPHVSIDTVAADDRSLPANTAASLPPGTTKIQIGYTAPDLTSPLRMRFRYRLDGFDADWIDAGARREALYTNLPPRRYRFRVAASGDEGRWAETEASWDFGIAPRFYLTLPFYALVALGIALVVWGAWQWRLRQLRTQFALVLGERVRVSRELHDTLLQSLVGIALEFDAIARSLDHSPAAARQRVTAMRERVEEYIREARRSIWSLRSPALDTRDLVEALRESGERAAAGQAVRFDFDLQGTPRRYAANLEHQLLRIGQEAVLNAVRHARARSVKMTLDYADDRVALRVADDGTGFAAERTGEGTTDHYGITTMKERAEQVGGRVTITSRPEAGTVIEAVVPTAASAMEEQ